MTAAAEISALTAQIRTAFQDVLRGEGVSLSETQVLDDYGGTEARQEARSWDTDTHWWEVSDEDLLDGHYITYLDDLGWRYYLPAFMTHSLKILNSPRTGTSDTRSHTLHMLIFYDQGDLENWERRYLRESRPLPFYLQRMRADQNHLGDQEKRKWSILTTEQSRAVCLYLRFAASHDRQKYEAQKAEKGLRQHWGQFCEGE